MRIELLCSAVTGLPAHLSLFAPLSDSPRAPAPLSWVRTCCARTSTPSGRASCWPRRGSCRYCPRPSPPLRLCGFLLLPLPSRLSHTLTYEGYTTLCFLPHTPSLSLVLASPGFTQSGVSRHLFERWCDDDRNGVVIAGYTVEGACASLPRRPLLRTAEQAVIAPRNSAPSTKATLLTPTRPIPFPQPVSVPICFFPIPPPLLKRHTRPRAAEQPEGDRVPGQPRQAPALPDRVHLLLRPRRLRAEQVWPPLFPVPLLYRVSLRPI